MHDHTSAISAGCSQLIRRAASYHPLYGDNLSNHLPMALIALDRMGASAARLEAFFEHYRPKLRFRSAPAAAATDPAASFGVAADFEGVFAFFKDSIAKRGVDAVLREWLPRLIPGVAASAFHAAIRLGYGLEASDDSEVCFGLADWVIEYQSLGDLGERTDDTLDELAASLARSMEGHRFQPGIIVDRMAEVARMPAVRALATQPRQLDFQTIASFAIRSYAAKEDFTLLHLVTGCHAFRKLMPYMEAPDSAVRYLWQAVLVGFLSTGLPYRRPATAAPIERDWECDWRTCLESAVRSDNDHTLKLIYTAWQESIVTGDPLHLYVAARLALRS